MEPVARRPDSVVIVGAGLAGSYAAAGLRRRGFTGHLVLVGAESHRPYDRPPLSKGMLAGQPPHRLEDDLGTDLDEVCDEVLLGHRASRLEPGLVAGTGWEEPADAVLVACGARAARPQGWQGALTLRTMEDAERLRARLEQRLRLVVVGAGWIGAEVAGAAAGAGCDVTVVEALPGPLAREVGAAGELTRGWWAAAGVRLLTGRRVVGASGDRVDLDDGERLPADVVLLAVGVVPDVGWLGESAPGGVEVGPDLRCTGPLGPGVLAAGDCAVRWSPRYSAWTRGGHWEEAMLAGDAAAASLLGEPVVHDPVPYVFSTQFGRELALVGRVDRAARLVLRGDPSSGEGWAAGWLRDAPDGEHLVALLTVDRPRDLAQVRRALAAADGHGVRVDAAVLADAGQQARAALHRA